MSDKTVSVKNRGAGNVTYIIPDLSLRRTFAPGEVKKNISVDELEKLTYVPGGMKIMQKYLVINDKEVTEELGIVVEPEYFYDEVQIKELLESGSLEQFLDCLDFAPEGVLDLIKKMAVDTKLNDVSKRNAIKKTLGFDVTKAIENVEFDKTVDAEDTTKVRRAAPVTETKVENKPTGRRYNVTSRG